MSVLWTIEFPNNQIHFESRRENQEPKAKQQRCPYLFSEFFQKWQSGRADRRMEPRSHEALSREFWPTRTAKQRRSSEHPGSSHFTHCFHPLAAVHMTVTEPKVRFSQSLLPFPNKDNPLYCCPSQLWGQRIPIPTGEKGRKGAKENKGDIWLRSGLVYFSCLH